MCLDSPGPQEHRILCKIIFCYRIEWKHRYVDSQESGWSPSDSTVCPRTAVINTVLHALVLEGSSYVIIPVVLKWIYNALLTNKIPFWILSSASRRYQLNGTSKPWITFLNWGKLVYDCHDCKSEKHITLELQELKQDTNTKPKLNNLSLSLFLNR